MKKVSTIAVCSTGDTWDVCQWDKSGNDVDEPIWCQTKADAMKLARQLFNAADNPFRLIVESKGACEFRVVRERNA